LAIISLGGVSMINPNAKETIHSLKTKFTLIYILNCTDILFTYTLLKTGDFYEANFLMRSIVSNPFLSVLVKVIFPACLIYALFPYFKEEKMQSIKLCQFLIAIVLLAYLAINCLHVYYLISILISI
jgi:hypothetical protein